MKFLIQKEVNKKSQTLSSFLIWSLTNNYQNINETLGLAIKMVMASIKDILVILKSLLGSLYVLCLPLFLFIQYLQLCLVETVCKSLDLLLAWSNDAMRDKSLLCTSAHWDLFMDRVFSAKHKLWASVITWGFLSYFGPLTILQSALNTQFFLFCYLSKMSRNLKNVIN